MITPAPAPAHNRKGFTLIELLTVIAIIGILAAVLFPGVAGVMRKAKQSTAQTKVRNIAQAYIAFASTGNKFVKQGAWSPTTPSQANSVPDFGAVLSYNSNLNAAELWYVEADQLNDSANFTKVVLVGVAPSQTINPDFSTASVQLGFHSWTTYVPTPRNLTEQTPLFWARGLTSAGKWDATTGCWGAEGGHIAFGDSHVTWYQDTSTIENQFVSKTSPGTMTPDWKQAISLTVPNELKSR